MGPSFIPDTCISFRSEHGRRPETHTVLFISCFALIIDGNINEMLFFIHITELPLMPLKKSGREINLWSAAYHTCPLPLSQQI